MRNRKLLPLSHWLWGVKRRAGVGGQVIRQQQTQHPSTRLPAMQGVSFVLGKQELQEASPWHVLAWLREEPNHPWHTNRTVLANDWQVSTLTTTLFAFPFPPLPQLEGHCGAIGSCQPRSPFKKFTPNDLLHTILRCPFYSPLSLPYGTLGPISRASGPSCKAVGRAKPQSTALTEAIVCPEKQCYWTLKARISASIQGPMTNHPWSFWRIFGSSLFMLPEQSQLVMLDPQLRDPSYHRLTYIKQHLFVMQEVVKTKLLSS